MRQVLLFLCLSLVLPGSALAASDIVATYKYSDGSVITLVTRDKDHVRMDTSPTSYMLLAGGKVYSVNCEDGQCHAMDMGAMMNSSLGSMFGGGGDDETGYEVRYEKTGRSESVAGYKGAVYEAVTFENGEVINRDEMVLSNHSNIKRLTEGWIAMAEVMTQSMGDSFDDSLDEARKMGYGGVLRVGDDMRLQKLSVKNLSSSYYKLPSTAQQVEARQAPQQQSNDMGLEDDAKDIGYDAKEATKGEIKGGIRDAISDLFN